MSFRKFSLIFNKISMIYFSIFDGFFKLYVLEVTLVICFITVYLFMEYDIKDDCH